MICPDVPSINDPNIVENGPVVFRKEVFEKIRVTLAGKVGDRKWAVAAIVPRIRRFSAVKALVKGCKIAQNRLQPSKSSTVASFGRENDICTAEAQMC